MAKEPPGPTQELVGTVDLQVVAEGMNGTNVLQFKMKMATTFGKMMTRWCQHHGVTEGQAQFMLSDGSSEVKAEDTPAKLGWLPTKPGEEMTIRVQPRSSPEGDGKPQGRGSKRSRPPGGGGGEQQPPLKRGSSALQLYSKQRRTALLEDKPELKGRASEQSKVLAAEFKELPEEARKPFEEEAVIRRAAAAVGNERAAAAAAGASQAAAGGISGAAPLSAMAAVDPETKLSVVVVAQGSDGPSEVRFMQKASTPLAKLMAAWCEHHDIPEGEACFIWNGRTVFAEETVTMLGVDLRSELQLSAVPRESTDAKRAQGVRRLLDEEAKKLAPPETAPGGGQSQAIVEAADAIGSAAVGAESQAPPGRSRGASGAKRGGGVAALDSAGGLAAPSSPPPKRPCTAYFLFSRARRKAVTDECAPGPKDSFKQISARVGQMVSAEWKALSQEAREPYEEEASMLMQQYKIDKAAYLERHPELARKGAKRRRVSVRKAAAGREEELDLDGGDSDDSASSALSAAAAEGLRRSTRLRESPTAHMPACVTLVHHPPPDGRRKRKSGAALELTEGKEEEDKLLSAEPGFAPRVDEEEPEPEHMTYREYLSYDKEQERARTEARRRLQQQALVNGGEDSDEEVQFARALSLSESQTQQA